MNVVRTGFRVGLVILALLLLAGPAGAQAPFVEVLTVEGQINPAVAGYIAREVRQAGEEGAICVILQLDTPGGLMASTGEIVRTIFGSTVPVVVYVSPQGARAASAGLYITYAAHVAAMAPGTHIGAATPVSLGPEGQVELPEEMQRKIEEDALAQLRASAQVRGRNLEWAEQAVREAASATADEALDLDVVEVIARDLPDLLAQLDGRTIRLDSGVLVTLHTAGAAVRERPMTTLDRFLQIITQAEVAYLLLSLGGLGLWVEFSKPGVQLPGVLGGVCILLALYGLGTLSVNWAGVLLILLSFVLFAFDVVAPTHFVLTTGGIVAFVAGSLLLFQGGGDPYLRISPWLIGAVAGTLALLVVVMLLLVIRGHRRPVVSGPEALIGMVGTVRRPLEPEGMVFTDGALWQARSLEDPIEAGARVEIVALEGLRLLVRRHRPGAEKQVGRFSPKRRN